MQNKITEPSDLLDKNGHLVQKGWARQLLMNYNKENIAAGPLRIKEWDYYAILNHEFGITFTIADLGFAGLINVVWLDFNAKTFISDEIMVLLTKGRFNMPRSSEKGDIILEEGGISLSFIKKEKERLLKFDFPGFNNGEGIKADLSLIQNPNSDTMVIATPWKENPTRFYYNQKINNMPCTGNVKKGSDVFEFKADADQSYGVLDWGRGVWTHKNTWYWGSASDKLEDGTKIGWNLGYGFSDRSYATENLIFYEGKGHKIDKVKFVFDGNDFLKPWTFSSNDGRFEATMHPLIDRNSKTNLLIIKSVQHQVFGLFDGYFILDDGTKVEFKNILGFAEEVYNKW